ncbi:hypothetical protein EC973_005126 [Apophysomyces ossiformis]|uniref:Uncharacterized protein n=1 Tax=Apophysomyces ossiformis TaxID=679940 RepID=A0A8H7BKJ6_9FUNG|nr:hypothetical protein EC973_005126 [Apophysomyces ossiformis]
MVDSDSVGQALAISRPAHNDRACDEMTKMTLQAKLFLMKSELSPTKFRIAKSIAMLVQKLPVDSIENIIMEQKLITRFVEPALAPLFEDTTNNILFRWTSTMNDEYQTTSIIAITQDRHDACTSTLNGTFWGTSCGFGEVKCFSQAENKFLVWKDLIRLGYFSKNAIDVHKMNGVLAFQVMGRHVFFYLTKLMHDGLYLMLQVDKIKLPVGIKLGQGRKDGMEK